MSVKKMDYEELLTQYSSPEAVTKLLRLYRPYLEMIPSMRRPHESIIAIPLPTVRITPPLTWQSSLTSQSGSKETDKSGRAATILPCDVGILMCDPEWKVKLEPEILVFIQRPKEDFYEFISRWRQTQVFLDKSYEWIMPLRYKHIYGEGAEKAYPLFVVFEKTPERIKRGLKGAGLPFVVHALEPEIEAKQELPTEIAEAFEEEMPANE